MEFGDLMDRVAEFDEQLDHYLRLVRDKSKDNSTRLATYCLALHRRQQECVMGGLKPKQLQAAREAKINLGPDSIHVERLVIPDTAPEKITGQQLIKAAICYNTEMLSLCKTIMTNRISNDVRVVLKACAGVKERDIIMLKKMLTMKYF